MWLFFRVALSVAMRVRIRTCLLTIVPIVPGADFSKGRPSLVIGLLIVVISRFLAAKAARPPCN